MDDRKKFARIIKTFVLFATSEFGREIEFVAL